MPAIPGTSHPDLFEKHPTAESGDWADMTEEEIAEYAVNHGLNAIPEDYQTDMVLAAREEVVDSLTKFIDGEIEFYTGEGYPADSEFEFLHEQLENNVTSAVDAHLANQRGPLHEVLRGHDRQLVQRYREAIIETLADTNIYQEVRESGTFGFHVDETEVSIHADQDVVEEHHWDTLDTDEVKAAVKAYAGSSLADRLYTELQRKSRHGFEVYTIVSMDAWFSLDIDEARAETRVNEILEGHEVTEEEASEDLPPVEVVWTFPNIDTIDPTGSGGRGWYVARLDWLHLALEGATLGHCIGQEKHGYPERVRSGRAKVYSLRTANGKPKFTIYQDLRSGRVEQVKGKANRLPEKPLEAALLKDFLAGYLGVDPANVSDMQGRRENPSVAHCGFCRAKRKR